MDINEAKRLTGFIAIEFIEFVDPGDNCEKCECISEQLYWRSCDPFSQDGEYFCGKCVTKEATENARFN